MTFEAKPLTPRIATQVDSDAQTLMGGSHAKRSAPSLSSGCPRVPRADLTDEQQIAFARTLGGVIEQGEKGIFKVTLDTKENVMADYLRGTILWHIDGFSDDVPTLASMLSARRLSPEGGQTELPRDHAAFDDLPSAKQELQKLRVVHTMIATQRDVFPNRRRRCARPGRGLPTRSIHSCGRTARDANLWCWDRVHRTSSA